MKKKTVTETIMKKDMNDILEEALALLQKEDGKPFEEKKKEVANFLREKAATTKTGRKPRAAVEKTETANIKEHFWADGNVQTSDSRILLRPVCDSDREGFLELKRTYSEMKSRLEDETFQAALWREHTAGALLMLSIAYDRKYIGYCGINDTTRDLWEISIELLPGWTGRGIGFIVLTAMLDAIKSRLSISSYQIRIEPTNYRSQSLTEKLGAVPKGIVSLWIHDPQKLEQIEEENLHLIDKKLTAVAEKFGVAPRKLLSHVLEYRLEWKQEEVIS